MHPLFAAVTDSLHPSFEKLISQARDEFANVNNKVHTAIFELLEPTFRDQVLLNLGYNKDLSFPEVMTLIRSLLPKGNIITELIDNLEALSIQNNDLHKFISTARVFVYNNKRHRCLIIKSTCKS